jgi:3-oxoacyl-[acyl-carrier-protein] synthase I
MTTPPTAPWLLRVTAVGAACSLGLDAVTAMAAADAGLVRASALRTVNAGADEVLAGEAVIGHAIPCGRADGFSGIAKALQLARLALADLAERASPASALATVPPEQVCVYLALSDRWLQDRAAALSAKDSDGDEAIEPPSQRWRRDATTLGERLLAEPAARRLGIGACRVVFGGHTAVALALDRAAYHLASGRVLRAYVAAVDSCIEPREVQAAAVLERLKTEARPVGFLPGEAAICLAVEPCASLSELRADIGVSGLGQTRVPAEASAAERGRALAAAVAAAAHAWPAAAQAASWQVCSDLNGDLRRAEEWGHCLVHLQAAGHGDLAAPDCIAAVLGECGTAGPAAALALQWHRARRGRRAAWPALMPLSSDDGHKAALVVH